MVKRKSIRKARCMKSRTPQRARRKNLGRRRMVGGGLKKRLDLKKRTVGKKVKESGLKRETAQKTREAYKKRWKMFETALGRAKLIEMGGENTISVLKEFSKDMSDEELAKKTKIKVSEVRAVLNRLHSNGFVEYAREKDSVSGWYSYIWKLREDTLERFLEYCKGSGETDAGLVSIRGEKYMCRCCGPKSIVLFDVAFENGFVCPLCRGKMEYLEENEKGRFLSKEGA